MKEYAIGIDLGATQLRIAAVDKEGAILFKVTQPTDAKAGGEATIEQIRAGVAEIQHKISHPPLGVGVGIAGMVDLSKGRVLFAPNLNWHHLSLVKKLENLLSLPVKLMNDVRAITSAELLIGEGKKERDFVCIIIGTGVGGGVVSSGHLIQGSQGNLGEIGHFVIEREGRSCTCGSRGCLEAYVGGWALAQAFFEKNGKETTAKEVVEAYRKKDVFAKEVVGEAIAALAAGLQTIVYAYNPKKIIFGGTIVDHLPELVVESEKRVKNSIPEVLFSDLSFVRSRLKGESGMIGAASLFF